MHPGFHPLHYSLHRQILALCLLSTLIGCNPTTTAYRITKITDGDSFTVQDSSGKTEEIRLCGIDAPELAQPLGPESKAALAKVAPVGSALVVTPIKRDRYGRIVAEVFLADKPPGSAEEVFLQQEQLVSGMAYVYPRYINDCPNASGMQNAEAIGKQARIGVWAGSYEKPWDYRRRS